MCNIEKKIKEDVTYGYIYYEKLIYKDYSFFIILHNFINVVPMATNVTQ
ncbi:MAG: hypothetical protein ACTSRZ_07500 [Promethearchaeota archaeon]